MYIQNIEFCIILQMKIDFTQILWHLAEKEKQLSKEDEELKQGLQ